MGEKEGAYTEREEFINYLENHNVLNHLSSVLLKLFNEKERPQDAIKYIRENLYNPSDAIIEDLRKENKFLRLENQQLTKKYEELNVTLSNLIKNNSGRTG